MKRFTAVLIITFVMAFLSACRKEVADDSTVLDTILMEASYEDEYLQSVSVNYEVDEIHPGIIISVGGYETSEEKIVILKKEAGVKFYIHDAVTGEIVFEGVSEECGEEGVSRGRFTEFDSEGVFYISADTLGRSNDFEISDSVYKDAFISLTTEICDEDMLSNPVIGSAAIMDIMLAYELNKNIFEDNDISESVMESISNIVSETVTDEYCSILTDKEKLFIVAALSRFSGIYKNYDELQAGVYLSLSEALYEEIQEPDEYSEEFFYYYMAAAQLYRVTGKDTYYLDVTFCYEKDGGITDFPMSEDYTNPVFFGNYAYLTTPRQTDNGICYSIMDSMMNEVMNYSSVTGSNIYGNCVDYSSDVAFEDIGLSVLDCMRTTAYANYIITNSEYREMMRDNYHFLTGYNEDSCVITDIWDEDDSDSYDVYCKSMLLVLLSQADNVYDGTY